MLQELLASGTLNIVYAIIVVISFLFALASLLGLGLDDVLDFDFGGDSGLDFISISPFALAMFGSAFGLVGLITRLWLEIEPIPSVVWALGAGLLIGGLGQAFFLIVLAPSKSSHFSLADDAINREAEVVLTIPESGVGSVSYNNVSGRVTVGARSSTGTAIPTGKLVVIEKIVGRVVLVHPVEDVSGPPGQGEPG